MTEADLINNPSVEIYVTPGMKRCNKGHEFPARDPYCSNGDCLTYNVLGTYVEPTGLMTYVEGFKYPLPGFPTNERLDATASVKRGFLATLKLALWYPFTFFIIFMPRKRTLKRIADYVTDVYHADYIKKCLPLNQFSVASRELIRVLTQFFGEQPWIYCLVMFFETDMAYRYRPKDVIVNVDKQKLIDNPRKEINRLFDIALERELNINVIPKWKMFRLLWNVIYFVSPMIRKAAIALLLQIDLEKIGMTINDKYWVAVRFDYNYLGMTYDQRMDWKRAENGGTDEWVGLPVGLKEIEPPPDKPRLVLNPPNKEFYMLNNREAREMAENVKQMIINDWTKKNAKA